MVAYGPKQDVVARLVQLKTALAHEAAAEIVALRSQLNMPSDLESGEFLVNGIRHYLTSCEQTIFRRLLKSPGELVTQEALLSSLYSGTRDGGPECAQRTLRLFIMRLRRKTPWPIKTVHGRGYILVMPQ